MVRAPTRWRHWDQWDRVPRSIIAASSVPRAGAVRVPATRASSSSTPAGSIETGRRRDQRQLVGPRQPTRTRPSRCIMDVMRDHGIKVDVPSRAVRDDRARSIMPTDILYLLTRIRREAALGLLPHARTMPTASRARCSSRLRRSSRPRSRTATVARRRLHSIAPDVSLAAADRHGARHAAPRVRPRHRCCADSADVYRVRGRGL